MSEEQNGKSTEDNKAAEDKPAEAAAKPAEGAAEKKAVAVAEKPAEKAPEEKPVNSDIFTSCTSRITRRAWNIFLEYNTKDLEPFKNRPVRGRLTASSAKAAQEFHKILVEEGGVREITTHDNVVEFTAPLATVQLVIKHPDARMFDAVKGG